TSGYTDKMVCFVRDESSSDYKISYELLDLEKVANVEKKIPLEWIDIKNRNVTNEVIDYILPLIQGELDYPFEDGLPRFARLRKVLVQK
ncbi:MAG: 6-phosphofructokinase, partial [Acholeplasmataceae bacterium]|nr:6-phosphofructokinase [Acholeplasmataceae bacterium]